VDSGASGADELQRRADVADARASDAASRSWRPGATCSYLLLDAHPLTRRGTMSNAAKTARPSTAGAVLQNHLRAATVGVDAVMQDYTDQSVLVTHDATYRGLEEIRGFFSTLFRELPAGFFDEMKMIRQEIVGDTAYILWERKPIISRATDTFVMRDGKILFQTFTAALQ
jgi:hypothetical protein